MSCNQPIFPALPGEFTLNNLFSPLFFSFITIPLLICFPVQNSPTRVSSSVGRFSFTILPCHYDRVLVTLFIKTKVLFRPNHSASTPLMLLLIVAIHQSAPSLVTHLKHTHIYLPPGFGEGAAISERCRKLHWVFKGPVLDHVVIKLPLFCAFKDTVELETLVFTAECSYLTFCLIIELQALTFSFKS